MSDLSPSVPTRRPIRLVPGVIYEWTPEETTPFALVGQPQLGEERPAPVASSFAPGTQVIPGYELVERIGGGCTGDVWRAVGPGNVAVALKFIVSQQRGGEQELRALATMQGVRHPHLAVIFGTWETDHWAAIGMDLADESLLDRFEAALAAGRVGLEFDELVGFLGQAAEGIDFLNEPRHVILGEGPVALIHRDIKPANLLLQGGSLKVGDFGLVKRLEADPSPGTWSATDWIESLVTAYSAPEIRQGMLSGRSDQYSLAATYCHLRGGRPPSPAGGAVGLLDEGHDALNLTMLPPAERPAVARALAADPARRWPSCSAFVAALAASAHQPAPDPTPQLREAAPRALVPPRPRRRVAPIAAALLAVAGPATLALIWSRQSAPVALQPAPIVAANQVAAPPSTAPGEVREIAPRVAVEPEARPIALQPTPAPVVAAVEPPAPPDVASAEPPAPPPPALDVPPVAEPILAAAPPAPSGDEVRAALAASFAALQDRIEPRLRAAHAATLAWVASLPRPKPPEAAPAPVEPPVPRTATVIVRMPSTKAELVVRGEVGRGNPDEWYGPRRIIHSPPLSASQDYLIGAFWTDPNGQPTVRSQTLKVEPGRRYEVDLRADPPSVAEVPRAPDL